MGFTLTGGEALYGQGFTQLACLDVSGGHPGVRKVATFHPSEIVLRDRYGGLNIFGAVEYLPEQNAGAHAAGLNSQAPALLPAVMERLGTPIAANPQRDALDLSLLVGATQWVIQKAIEFKLLEPAAPPVLPQSPPVVPPAQPPAPGSGLHPLSPASVRVEELFSHFTTPTSEPGVFWPKASVHLALGTFLTPTGWRAWRPVFIEALRFYRGIRRFFKVDDRPIPAEDR